MARKKKAMDIFILLDRTGSMSPIWKEAVSSVNAYVEELVKDGADDKVTLAVFDGYSGLDYKVLRDSVLISNWNELKLDEVSPRGTTPLHDAMMRIIADAEEVKNKKTILVVMTDGHENASRENTKENVKAAIDRLEKKGWQINFLGVNFNAFDDAHMVGVNLGQTINVQPQYLPQTMCNTAYLHSGYRGSPMGQSVNYTSEDRLDSGEDGIT
jgi:Mg-chelatase subunit ChlD